MTITGQSIRDSLNAYRALPKSYLMPGNYQNYLPADYSVATPSEDILNTTVQNAADASTLATSDVQQQAAAAEAAKAAKQQQQRIAAILKASSFQPQVPGQGGNGFPTWDKPVDAPVARKFGVNNKPGVAFDTNAGDKVTAIANGQIVAIQPNGTIIVKTGQQYQSIYRGIANVRGDLKVGQVITKGTVLGRVGDPNLKLETLKGGEAFNPFKAFIHGMGGSWRHKVVQYAKAQLGTDYVWGAENPGHAFDCSGLVQYVYSKMGFQIPRTAAEQAHVGRQIPMAALRPGDLVFWDYGGTNGADHVAIYAGNGQIIEAAHSGEPIHKVPLNWDLSQAFAIRVSLGKVHSSQEGP